MLWLVRPWGLRGVTLGENLFTLCFQDVLPACPVIYDCNGERPSFVFLWEHHWDNDKLKGRETVTWSWGKLRVSVKLQEVLHSNETRDTEV